MKKFVMPVATLVISGVGLFGVNALRVAKEDVKTAVTEMLPTEFRQKLSKQEMSDQRQDLAEVAVSVDRDVLPRYATFLPGATYSDLQKNDFRPFRSMLANLDAGSEKLATAMRCLTASGGDEYGAKKEQLDKLADRARADLKLMEDLQARVTELNELAGSLANAVGSLNISEGPALCEDRRGARCDTKLSMTALKVSEDRDGRQSTSGSIRVRVASGRNLQFGETIGRKIPRQEFGHIGWCFAAGVGTRFEVPVQPSARVDLAK